MAESIVEQAVGALLPQTAATAASVSSSPSGSKRREFAAPSGGGIGNNKDKRVARGSTAGTIALGSTAASRSAEVGPGLGLTDNGFGVGVSGRTYRGGGNSNITGSGNGWDSNDFLSRDLSESAAAAGNENSRVAEGDGWGDGGGEEAGGYVVLLTPTLAQVSTLVEALEAPQVPSMGFVVVCPLYVWNQERDEEEIRRLRTFPQVRGLLDRHAFDDPPPTLRPPTFCVPALCTFPCLLFFLVFPISHLPYSEHQR